MSISSYLPDEALQGQDVPSHIIWEDVDFDLIEIVLYPDIQLKEIYNLKKENYKIEDNKIIINNKKQKGYIGIVYNTLISKEKAIDKIIKYVFYKDGEIIEVIAASVHMFRADIILNKVPESILVKFDNGSIIKEKIYIQNYGEGTAIVQIETVEDSQIIKEEPKWVQEFQEFIEEDVDRNIDSMITEHPEHDELLIELRKQMISPINLGRDNLHEVQTFLERYFDALKNDARFAATLSFFLINVIDKMQSHSNVFNVFNDYIKSIRSQKIIIKDPFGVIKITTEKQTIKIKLSCVDLLQHSCETYDLDPITIEANRDGEIPIINLFHWGVNDVET